MIILPTTSMSPDTMVVWKDGASADTSQLNLPDNCVSTDNSTMLLPLDKFGFQFPSVRERDGPEWVCVDNAGSNGERPVTGGAVTGIRVYGRERVKNCWLVLFNAFSSADFI